MTSLDDLTEEELDHVITTAEYRIAARLKHGEEGEVEIDPGATVSEGDEGAYVQAWVWISHEGVHIQKRQAPDDFANPEHLLDTVEQVAEEQPDMVKQVLKLAGEKAEARKLGQLRTDFDIGDSYVNGVIAVRDDEGKGECVMQVIIDQLTEDEFPGTAAAYAKAFMVGPALIDAADDLLSYMEGYEKDYNHGEPIGQFEAVRQLIAKGKGH